MDKIDEESCNDNAKNNGNITENCNVTEDIENSPDNTPQDHPYITRSKVGLKPKQYDKVYNSDYQFALALTQVSATKGIKLFGQQAIDALSKEWKQLGKLTVFKGRKYHSLTWDKRCGALRTVQLIKKKKDGRIKGRTCVNGS